MCQITDARTFCNLQRTSFGGKVHFCGKVFSFPLMEATLFEIRRGTYSTPNGDTKKKVFKNNERRFSLWGKEARCQSTWSCNNLDS